MSTTAAENGFMKFWYEDDILCGCYEQGVNLTLAAAQACVTQRIAFGNHVPHLCLFDIQGIKSATSEARQYLSTEGARFIKASALITNSGFSRILGNTFLTVNKPAVPTKLFTSKEEAKMWLLNQVNVLWPI